MFNEVSVKWYHEQLYILLRYKECGVYLTYENVEQYKISINKCTNKSGFIKFQSDKLPSDRQMT